MFSDRQRLLSQRLFHTMVFIFLALYTGYSGWSCNGVTAVLQFVDMWYRILLGNELSSRFSILKAPLMAPPYLVRDLQWTDEAESLRRLRSGSQQHLIVPRTRLRTIGDRSFRVTAAHAWNSLPTSVTTATSLASFKRQLKTFLFTKSFPEL